MVNTTKNEAQLFLEIRQFVAQQTGIKAEKVYLESRFEEDLRISGDDLVELLDAFFIRFEVAVGDFKYEQYISNEGLSLLGGVADHLLRRKPNLVTSIDVSMLVSAAQAGQWDSTKLATNKK
jgi:acyl carrier protein